MNNCFLSRESHALQIVFIWSLKSVEIVSMSVWNCFVFAVGMATLRRMLSVSVQNRILKSDTQWLVWLIKETRKKSQWKEVVAADCDSLIYGYAKRIYHKTDYRNNSFFPTTITDWNNNPSPPDQDLPHSLAAQDASHSLLSQELSHSFIAKVSDSGIEQDQPAQIQSKAIKNPFLQRASATLQSYRMVNFWTVVTHGKKKKKTKF